MSVSSNVSGLEDAGPGIGWGGGPTGGRMEDSSSSGVFGAIGGEMMSERGSGDDGASGKNRCCV